MKKILFILFALMVGNMALVSCHDDSVIYEKENTGTINLTTLDMKLNLKTAPATYASRAGVDIDNYIVGVYTEANEVVKEWVYSEMPQVFTLKAGNYKLVAHSPNTDTAAFDEPYCYGETEMFEVKKDEVTDAGVLNCNLSSIKVTIKYKDNLYEILGDDAKVNVTVGKESLEFVKTETRSGFFHAKPAENSVHVKFTATIEGSPVVSNKLYTGIKNGTELVITYDMKESQGDPSTGGSITPGAISIIEDCEIIELSFNVLPNDDIIADFGKPSIKGKDFDITQHVTDLTKPVVVLLNAPEGMSHVNVNITSTNSEFVGAVNLIFPTLPFDLAYPDEKVEANLQEFGFPYKDQIIGQQGIVEFSITKFLEPLSFFPGIHTFSIEVIDIYGDKANEDLVIEIESK